MHKEPRSSQRGQVLVLVALAIIALVAIVALAVDGGNVYAERRRMQNAADAGALAGARELCIEHGTLAEAEAIAQNYAIDRNGADLANVFIATNRLTVTVETSKTAQTYFAGVIGFRDIDVTARATAQCNRALRAGGIWPLAAHVDLYNNVLECNEEFYAFIGTPDIAEPDKDPKVECEYLCDCDDIPLPGATGVTADHLSSANRGWLRLFPPTDPYPNPCPSDNCGANYVDCWLKFGHPGPINIGDCLAGKPGKLGGNVASPINDFAAGNIYNLVLFDRACNESDDPPTLGSCPPAGGNEDERSYHVAGFGCVEVIKWDTINIPTRDDPKKMCTNNEPVVFVRKMCGEICETDIGSGSGEPDQDDVRAVTLIE